MPYPDKLLAEDEDVVRHLHPHWLTLFWPVVRLLLVIGAASFGAALVPPGPQQGVLRLAVVGLALALLLPMVAVPVLRWWTTHHVITTHRLLFREGVLTRRGRDLGLSRIVDVSYTQTLWERIIRSGTVRIETAGDGGPTVLRHLPDSEGVQHLLNLLIEADADRRAQQSAGYVGEQYREAAVYGTGYATAYGSGAGSGTAYGTAIAFPTGSGPAAGTGPGWTTDPVYATGPTAATPWVRELH